MTAKSRADLLATTGQFLERCLDDERAANLERLCQSAAPGCDPLTRTRHGRILPSREEEYRVREVADRVELFTCDYDHVFNGKGYTPALMNVARFPDLYGAWVYQPPLPAPTSASGDDSYWISELTEMAVGPLVRVVEP
jgi:hypothetical protein